MYTFSEQKKHGDIQTQPILDKYNELVEKLKEEIQNSESKVLTEMESYPTLMSSWSKMFDLGHPDLIGVNEIINWFGDKNKEFMDTLVSKIVEGPENYEDLSKFGEQVGSVICSNWGWSETSVMKFWQAAFQNPVKYTCQLVNGLWFTASKVVHSDSVEYAAEFAQLLLEFVKKLQTDREKYEELYPIIMPRIGDAVDAQIDNLENSKAYLRNILEIFNLAKEGYLEERNVLVEKGILPPEIRDDPDNTEDDNADALTPWRSLVTTILENVTYSGSVELYKKFTEGQFEFLYDVVMTTEYPPVCVRSGDGILCQCKIQELRVAAMTFVFERVPGCHIDYLRPHANDIFSLYQQHPRISVLRAYIQIYPQIEHDERFFGQTFRQLSKSRCVMQSLLFEYYKKVALIDPNRFEVEHVEKLEEFLEDRTQLSTTLELIVSIAEGNPKLFAGKGELYFEAIRNETVEELWFSANTILLCRATINEEEASDAVQRLISQTHVIKATSYVVDVLEKLETIAYVYPKVVARSKEMRFIEEKKKDPIYRKHAIAVEQAVNQKANGSTSCVVS